VFVGTRSPWDRYMRLHVRMAQERPLAATLRQRLAAGFGALAFVLAIVAAADADWSLFGLLILGVAGCGALFVITIRARRVARTQEGSAVDNAEG
jgi:hypothetical protein